MKRILIVTANQNIITLEVPLFGKIKSSISKIVPKGLQVDMLIIDEVFRK